MMKWFYPCDVNYNILDSNLVPITHYSFGDYRNPVAVCQTAFGFYDDYLETQEAINKQGFLNNVEWLLYSHDEEYYLHYEFDWTHHSGVKLPKGWVSAMAQGEALGAVTMAYRLTAEDKYLLAAQGFFKTLYRNTDSIWCIGVDNEDYYWLEEYPNKDFCHVLNGILFSLWGIWDYYVITLNEFALTLFKAGIKTIVDNYPIWNIENENHSYELDKNTNISIRIFNLNGQIVDEIFNGIKEAGYHVMKWDAHALSAGMYIIRMETSGFVRTTKCELIK